MVYAGYSHGKSSVVKEVGGEIWDLGSSMLGETLLTSLCLFPCLQNGETNNSYPIKSLRVTMRKKLANKRENCGKLLAFHTNTRDYQF